MPGAHRQDDKRFCDGTTIVTNQTTVFANDKLWAVQGDEDSHLMGKLVASTGTKNVYIEDKLVIVAVGDIASSDMAGHPTGPSNPKEKSSDVSAY